ncbi:MAG: ABC transporter ATP-binding protein [Balneolaceae bacterium]|nr:ABC transporter ATP-binding protein [Balneolaceae bacterium]MCH8549575.1 ABC transporter ATP-binding protein/permease [Balneolaceae bacterium]
MPSTLKKLFYILPKGDPLKLVVIFVLMMVAALLEVAGIGMIPAFVAIVADPEKVLGIERIQPLLQFLNVTDARDLLIAGSLALVGIFLLKSLYMISFNYFEARFIYARRYAISRRLMSSYMQAPYTFHLKRNSSELLRNITSEINVLVNVVLTNLMKMSREGIITFSILLFLFIAEPLITVLVIGLSAVGAGSFILFNRKRMKAYGQEEQIRRAAMIKAVTQGLGGIKDARVLNRETVFIERFSKEAYESTRLMAYIKFIQQIPKPVVETTAVVGMLLISVILVWQGRPMSSIIPILTLFAMATVRLMPSIQQLTSMYTNLRYNMVAIEPVYNDLRELEGVQTEFVKDRKSKKAIQLKDRIDIEDVYYIYPESEEAALKKISLSVPRGKAIAFVGESGAGKSTLVDLLLGLVKPTRGLIKVDGSDINQNISAWQRNIGYIPQSIYMSDDTMRRNIAFGLPDSEIDEKKMMEAVRLAQLEKVLKMLPDGLDTMIGENGTRLSGGQKQRIGIARALYHNPDVLVMDEATSALDNITEKQITKAIEGLRGDRTIIMIAHRLTTVQNCDLIYLMKDGEIIDSGTYDELVMNNKEFRKMAFEV